MSDLNLINFCETWMDLIYPLKEFEHQRTIWFNEDLWYRGSYTKDTSIFLEQYEIQHGNMKTLFNNNCCVLIDHLYESVKKFHPDTQRLKNFNFEKALLEDPRWKEIISLAQATYSSIESYKKEVERGKI